MFQSTINVFALAVLFSSPVGWALAPASYLPDSQNASEKTLKLALTNESFVAQAMLGSLAEVKFAEAALDKTKDPQIQIFAQHLITDNTTVLKELTQIAQNTGINVPYELDAAHTEVLYSLSALFGTEFDTAFSAHMFVAQNRTVSLFTAAMHDTSLQGVFRLFAIKSLSTVQAHRLDAQGLTKKYFDVGRPVITL
jgi:predicted outer membrane protein